jgi:hypothetical protein
MSFHRLAVRTLAAFAALAALAAAPTLAQVPATGIFVESENFSPPSGNATLTSGPNITNIVTVDNNGTASGGKSIGVFDAWDWLEYDVTIPEDGLYNVIYRYASNWGENPKFGQALEFFTAGQQITPPGAPVTATWGDYQLFTLPTPVPLKQGVNHFRIKERPDYGTVGFGGSMNMDYVKFEKAGAYPNLVAVSGTVTAQIGGTATPVQGALVSEDPDPAKGALYTEASHLTRTDAAGHYTLYLSPGSHQVTAFYNGFAAATAAVTAPGTHDFSLGWNGRFEAELFDATNKGPGNSAGVQPAYATGYYDVDKVTKLGTYSGNGLVINIGSPSGKFALYNHVVVPTAGYYDLSMHYGSDQDPSVTSPYNWQVNGTLNTVISWPGTGSYTTMQDSPTVLVHLNAGVNTLRWTDNGSLFANMDYFTLKATTQQVGTLNVSVKDGGGKVVPGAAISVSGDGGTYSGTADGNGLFSIVLPVGAYTVTASRSGTTNTADVTVAANTPTNAAITLNITAILVEGEDFTASGPDQPGPAVSVADLSGASGGKVLQNLSGRGDTGVLPSNYRYAEWTVDAPADGMYRFMMHYATLFSPGEIRLTVAGTSYRLHYETLTNTAGSTVYADFSPFEEIPLKKGPNTFRVTAGEGGLNVDYFTFDLDTASPAITFKTISGVVKGTDGTGSAPVRNAVVFDNSYGDIGLATYYTTTDATGHYTLNVPDTGLNYDGTSNLGVQAAGYLPQTVNAVPGNSTKDFLLPLNNPDAVTPPALRIDFADFYDTTNAVLAVGPGAISTAIGEIAFVQAGPDTWVDLSVSVPRSGLYDVALNYGSNALPAGQMGHLTLSAGGAGATAAFPMTATWADHQTIPAFVTLPLQAGPNTVRLAFPDAAANIEYLDFSRSGDLPPAASTDIDNNGVTDIRDAVIYARRLGGQDAGPTPDLTGDSASNAQDVRRILSVAGGLM